MRKYLSTLHTRSESHKKRFALATSGGVTLMIFAIWATVHFGADSAVVAEAKKREVKEVGPIASLWHQIGGSLGAVKDNLGELKQGFEEVDFESSYTNNGR